MSLADGIDRSREGMRRRIEELDKKHCKSAAELTQTFRELTALSRKELRLGIASAILQCLENLVIRTPHDTGRLRAGWRIGESPSSLPEPGQYPDFQNDASIRAALTGSMDPGTRLYEADVIWIYNNVEYVLALNADWSTRQPGGFIDKFLEELKEEFQKLVNY